MFKAFKVYCFKFIRLKVTALHHVSTAYTELLSQSANRSY